MKKNKLIAIIPVFNEEDSLVKVFSEVLSHTDLMIIVDDGSRDGSADRIRGWIGNRPGIYLLRHDRNRGMARALRSGFLFASRLLELGEIGPEDILINLDADGQHPVEQIPAVARKMLQEDLDILLVLRDFSLYPRYKVWGNRFLTALARLLTGFPYRDVESGFRLVRARCLHIILGYYTGWKYSCAQEIAVITALHGLNIRNDYPVRINYYRPGTTLSDGFAVLLMSFVAYLRVKAGWRSTPERLADKMDFQAPKIVCRG